MPARQFSFYQSEVKIPKIPISISGATVEILNSKLYYVLVANKLGSRARWFEIVNLCEENNIESTFKNNLSNGEILWLLGYYKN